MKPVCLVVGAGAGIGGTVGKRFAAEGYHVVLCRRSDAEGLNTLVADIKAEGGEASGCLLNAAEEHTLEDMISATEKGVGSIEVVVFNLGAQIGDRALQDTSHKAFELCWRLATLSLFRVASTVCPLMENAVKVPFSSRLQQLPFAAIPASMPMLQQWVDAACCASH